MAALEREIATLDETLADPDLYMRDAEAFNAAIARRDAAHKDLQAAEEEWLALELLREELET